MCKSITLQKEGMSGGSSRPASRTATRHTIPAERLQPLACAVASIPPMGRRDHLSARFLFAFFWRYARSSRRCTSFCSYPGLEGDQMYTPTPLPTLAALAAAAPGASVAPAVGAGTPFLRSDCNLLPALWHRYLQWADEIISPIRRDQISGDLDASGADEGPPSIDVLDALPVAALVFLCSLAAAVACAAHMRFKGRALSARATRLTSKQNKFVMAMVIADAMGHSRAADQQRC
eukprot:CAMPEP_0119398374 /NCGR_PEP_ID=MMETSP1334-20130426/140811_1 /TAXON_ID=127549 /ORGANISM="Calcidiscus leptoporus, Strain RCC1130" /LENGTH=233 /DNA_ID=CAMNT_0007422233 /DNA_START=264 /DNA_END=965 /DNA_ORIENTATION=-